MKPLLKDLDNIEKQGLVEAVREIMRNVDYFRYYEPYFTTGTVLCGLGLEQAQRVGISFINTNTQLFYQSVADNTGQLFERVNDLAKQQDRVQHNQLRTHFNTFPKMPAIDRAAIFYFLNQTCLRGVWDDDPGSDEFTRPFGRHDHKDPFISSNDLLAWAGRLNTNTIIYNTHNELLLMAECSKGLVYLNPPNGYRTDIFYQRVRKLTCPWIMLSDGHPEQLKANHIKVKKLLQPRFILLYSYGI